MGAWGKLRRSLRGARDANGDYFDFGVKRSRGPSQRATTIMDCLDGPLVKQTAERASPGTMRPD